MRELLDDLAVDLVPEGLVLDGRLEHLVRELCGEARSLAGVVPRVLEDRQEGAEGFLLHFIRGVLQLLEERRLDRVSLEAPGLSLLPLKGTYNCSINIALQHEGTNRECSHPSITPLKESSWEGAGSGPWRRTPEYREGPTGPLFRSSHSPAQSSSSRGCGPSPLSSS